MDSDSASIDIGDHEIWEQRRARLKALESVNGTHLQAEFKRRVNPLLHDAVKKGDVDKFIEALEKCSAEERVSLSDIIDTRGPSGNSLLHVAAGIENADILRALLEVIPDKRLAAEANYRGDTALHVAARAGGIYHAELLLGCGGIVHMANDMGNTALHEAVKNGDAKLTDLLLGKGSRAVYPANKESKCPLYLAAETGNLEILKLLMEAMDENEIPWSRMQGMSPVHGAVMHRRSDMLKEMSKRKKDLLNLRDARGGTLLHLAALMNYVDGVKFLVEESAWSAYVGDKKGYLPIHNACKMGHLKTIKELLQLWQDPEELLTLKEGQNILHVAAKYGRSKVVNYILDNPKLERLINAKDKEGNTPLHLATLRKRAHALFALILKHAVDLKLVNNGNLTALDIADEQRRKTHGIRENRIYAILVNAGAPRSVFYKGIFQPECLDAAKYFEPRDLDRLKDVANTRMVVATLLAAMSFAAGFSDPGGYNGDELDAGIPTLLNKPMYGIFVICNTVALYSSLIAIAFLHWTDRIGRHRMTHFLRIARLMVVIALVAMSVAFIAGVYVTVSKCTWITVVALIVAITALFIILRLHILVNPRVRHKLMRVFFSIGKWLEQLPRQRAAAA